MKEIYISILLTLLILPGLAQHQNSSQFDFWVGDWNIDQEIIDESGKWNSYKANTSVKYILGGKMIEENWKGRVKFYWAGMDESISNTGHSLRYYDESIEKWVIYWMDETQPQISTPYIGSFVSDSVALFYKEMPSHGLTSRIKFHIKNNREVDWQLAISDDKRAWKPIWKMRMTKL